MGIGVGWLVCSNSRCLPFRGGSSLQGSLTLVMPVSGLHIDLDQLEVKQHQIRTGGNIRVICFFLKHMDVIEKHCLFCKKKHMDVIEKDCLRMVPRN